MKQKLNYWYLLAASLCFILAAGLSLSLLRRSDTGPAGWNCGVLAVQGGYGYAVFCGSDTLIRQTCIPAIGRRRPFDTPADAMKVARRVCSKLESGQSPTLTPDEVEEALAGRKAGK